MASCGLTRQVESYFDEGLAFPEELTRHLNDCADCAAYLDGLKAMREGVKALDSHETIDDGQFQAFMAGIRPCIEEPVHPHRRRWAVGSLVAASMVVAVSLFGLFAGGPATVEAKTVVEYCSTDLEGATATWDYSKAGTATIRVSVPADVL